jgi:cardiolipin synthase
VQVFDRGGDGTPREPSSRILTVPNLFSLARLAILPWLYGLIVDERILLGLVVAGVFAATDFVDGYIARRFDQVTRLGQLLDPVSDRLFIITLLVALVRVGIMPWWLAAALVLRDLVLLVGGLVVLGRGGATPPVTRLGKATTFGLMGSIPLLMLGWQLSNGGDMDGAIGGVVLYVVGFASACVAAVLYWVVGVGYARTMVREARTAA